jgi:hypothetical protein
LRFKKDGKYGVHENDIEMTGRKGIVEAQKTQEG